MISVEMLVVKIYSLSVVDAVMGQNTRKPALLFMGEKAYYWPISIWHLSAC